MRPRLAALLVALPCLGPALATGAPDEAVHSLDWKVHTDLIDVAGGRPLSFYQDLLNERLAQVAALMQGAHGPADVPCCVRLDAVSVVEFGAPADGLDIIETQQELDAVEAFGPGAYLVDQVHFCAGQMSVGIRGCADVPPLAGPPASFLVVALEAEDASFFPSLIAHERGHNTGLVHVANNPCELMAASSGGGCLSTPECQAYAADGDSAGNPCPCLDDVLTNPPVADGEICTDVVLGPGRCSGALCRSDAEGGGTLLLAAGGLTQNAFTSAEDGVRDDAFSQSAVTGNWTVVTQPIAGGDVEITGLAYDAGRDVVFGIQAANGDDLLIRLDPLTGSKLGNVGTLDCSSDPDECDDVISLAYDPGNDRLLAIQSKEIDMGFNEVGPCDSQETMAFCNATLLSIDPDDASVSVIGDFQQLTLGGVQGLAYDSANGTLYGSNSAGLFSYETVCTGGGGFCLATGPLDANLSGFGTVRRPGALAYDPISQRLYREGATLNRSEFDVIDPVPGDPNSVLVLREIGIDPFTPGGLAAVFIPEPGRGLLRVAALAALGLLGRFRSCRARSSAS